MALSNTATPKYYGRFREAVMRGEIPVCKEISMEMNRIDDLIRNPGIYYDDKAMDGFVQFCEKEARREQANRRRREIEEQLRDSKYGIAWTDGTERVTQLNRSLENNLLKQIEYLTNMFYSQLGITLEIMNGTADEAAMTNYYNRIVEPIVSAITDEMKRKFLTRTARSQGQSILFFRDPFKLAPIGTVAEMADKFTRNEIMSSNEFRQVIGLKPSKDPRADELSNKNLNQSPDEIQNTAMAGGKETVDRLLAKEKG